MHSSRLRSTLSHSFHPLLAANITIRFRHKTGREIFTESRQNVWYIIGMVQTFYSNLDTNNFFPISLECCAYIKLNAAITLYVQIFTMCLILHLHFHVSLQYI